MLIKSAAVQKNTPNTTKNVKDYIYPYLFITETPL